MHDRDSHWLLPLLLAVAAAATLWYFWPQTDTSDPHPAAATTEAAPNVSESAPNQPRYPIALTNYEGVDRANLISLP